ncbi:hypothetical protein HBI04_121900 [Parastagonospora nodorum]|nr:hypothetical protein HBH49_150260 [Parastagonospora nodorum]KAH4104088.1 hypothetical protein HBH46_103480 [Parastagonospora nodorum]KAH4117648.1 hypothetical protein HBH47_152750 [Parastagonospora nodorum]KAH4266172.1 hypothetical protein HBI03_074720 [Parastagonospora nodorum]KAH4275467.1 hypothetical protein HBI04_121900 [Parastagonospora nodorum]
MLHNRLIRNPKGTSNRKAPVCRIKTYRGLLKGFTRATQRKEAVGREVGKDEDKDVERQVRNGHELF